MTVLATPTRTSPVGAMGWPSPGAVVEPQPQRREPLPRAADPAAAAARTSRRDRYIDTLRVLALVRVMTYHTFGFVWLPLVFPSMGVMFALAGSLVAGSLDRAPHGHYKVLGKRLRRLLPPVWVLGLVLVPVMLSNGWDATPAPDGEADPFSWSRLLLWVLPVGTPTFDGQGYDWVLPLWYIRSYLWFLVASPALLWLFRRWPVRTLMIFPLVVALQESTLIDLYDRAGDVVLSAGIYGACWLLGFAHHDGMIQRMRLRLVLPLGGLLVSVGLGYALLPGDGWNIDDIPLSACLYSLGFVLILLRFYPDFSWLSRHPWLDGLVSLMNARAMTIYLWGNVAIWAAPPVIDMTPLSRWYDESWRGYALQYGAAWLLVGLAVVAFGWVEDLAARRSPRLLPWPAGRPSRPTSRHRLPRRHRTRRWASMSSRRRRPAAPAPGGTSPRRRAPSPHGPAGRRVLARSGASTALAARSSSSSDGSPAAARPVQQGHAPGTW